MSIWKLQRPLVTNSSSHDVMAYTEDKEDLAFINMTQEQIDEVFGDELKIYVEAKVNKKTGMLVADRIVEEQDW